MRTVWLWMVVSSVALAAPAPKGKQEAAKRAEPAAALSAPDNRCPGGTVQGCVDGAAEASKRGDVGGATTMNEFACEADVGSACTALGEARLAGRGVPRDDATAVQNLERACALKDARGCSSLGSAVWQGRGVKKADPARAFKLFTQACNANDGIGCYSAAICHRTGSCAPKSAVKAKALLTKACKAGEQRACTELGTAR
jgi:TPR repeat protein